MTPTRTLARLLRPAGGGSPPRDPPAWTRLLSVADAHRLVPALAAAGRRDGWLPPVPASLQAAVRQRTVDGGLPPEVWLAGALDRNRARVDDLLDQAREVLAVLDAAGIAAAPLKGLDALRSGRYPDPAARTMTDLDVLVDPAAADDAWAQLRDLGYEPATAEPAEHHLPALRQPGRAGSVELHTQVLGGRWRALLPPAAALARSRPAADGPGRRLDRTDAALVLVAHAQLHDESRVLLQPSLRALHETALLLHGGEVGSEAVDWREVAARAAAVGAGPAVEEHLLLTQALFEVPSPLPASPGATRHGRVVLALLDRPRSRWALGQAAFLPRSFSAERMTALHGGPSSGPGLWWTRARHLSRGVGRRLRRR